MRAVEGGIRERKKLEIVKKDTVETAQYEGETWYPANTQLKITCPEDMTNLTLQTKYVDLLDNNIYTAWGNTTFNDENANIYTFAANYCYKYCSRIIDET